MELHEAAVILADTAENMKNGPSALLAPTLYVLAAFCKSNQEGLLLNIAEGMVRASVMLTKGGAAETNYRLNLQ